jgi:simple sugar transport system permease protein
VVRIHLAPPRIKYLILTTNESSGRSNSRVFSETCGGCAFVGHQAILYNSAQVSSGQSYIFNAIIAVVVGGVLLTGGYGSVFGIVLGTLTFAIVNQGIYYTGFDANWASLIIGILLLLAVLMNNTFRKLALAYSPGRGKTHK